MVDIAVMVSVYAVEERVLELVMGVGKKSERVREERCYLKSRSGHTRGHKSLMEGRDMDGCVEEREW